MPRIKRTIDECLSVAKRYTTRVDFQRQDKAIYLYCHRRNWLDIVCRHMVPQGSREFRYVYTIENEHSVYVGLTYNLASRQRAHRNSPKMVRIFGPDLTLTRVSGLLAKEEAAKLERTLVEQLVDSNKRSINSIKPGGLGGVIIKWDESALIAETEGYTRISDFRRDKPHVYAMFHRKGLLEKLREIMPGSDFPNGYWTFGRCRDEASRFKTRADFKFSSPKAYDAACRNGWLKDITSHMPVRSCHKRSNLFDPIRK